MDMMENDLYGNKLLEPRDYEFLSNHLDHERWANIMTYACTRGSLKEVCKAMREISYDQVCYYGEGSHGPIYDDEKYSDTTKEQANYLQRKISTVLDLFDQCITDGREFDWEYLYERLGK